MDGAGQVVSKSSYYPYGTRISHMAGEAPKYGFNDKRKEKNGDLLYYGARYYDPVARVFVSSDPLRWVGAEDALLGTNSLQPFLYVNGDPVNLADPTGMLPGESLGNLDERHSVSARKMGQSMSPKQRAIFGATVLLAAALQITAVATSASIAGTVQAVETVADVGNVCVAGADVYQTGGSPTSVAGLGVALGDLAGGVNPGGDINTARALGSGASPKRLEARRQGNPNTLGQQGPFRMTPEGQGVPPIGKFKPGDLVRHPRGGRHGKINYGTIAPSTGKFTEKVAVHPKEPGKKSNRHGGRDHYHLDRDKFAIDAPEDDGK